MSKKTKPDTVVTFVLDETGSMAGSEDQTVEACNEYIKTLQQSDEKITFSLIKFNSSRTEQVHTGARVKDVPAMARGDYRPNAMTPLIDAVMKAIIATAEYVKTAELKRPRVVITVLTDGAENTSRKYTRADLAQAVREKEDAGWQFVFLGADMDAFGEAQQYGMRAGNVMSTNKESLVDTVRATAVNTASYAATGDAGVLRYTDAQRKAAGDAKWGGKGTGEPADATLVDDIDLTK